ncbi:uncharacterized protein LOC121873637 [Homarus americanus]|uniref:uncharacterized protein LOC121873637 n=1 Tax=Homarus americanus TaxID=6706 RepID=UPI001C490E2E|nr:uncharacterized protein LOC121873637 [Homarus americanus]XP_042233231.1 uncharacterized protein LOC121873637 [Homarus americanus]XP_042233236.1 uncharacterized protein LOC121873637 [Homarus americanus]
MMTSPVASTSTSECTVKCQEDKKNNDNLKQLKCEPLTDSSFTLPGHHSQLPSPMPAKRKMTDCVLELTIEAKVMKREPSETMETQNTITQEYREREVQLKMMGTKRKLLSDAYEKSFEKIQNLSAQLKAYIADRQKMTEMEQKYAEQNEALHRTLRRISINKIRHLQRRVDRRDVVIKAQKDIIKGTHERMYELEHQLIGVKAKCEDMTKKINEVNGEKIKLQRRVSRLKRLLYEKQITVDKVITNNERKILNLEEDMQALKQYLSGVSK